QSISQERSNEAGFSSGVVARIDCECICSAGPTSHEQCNGDYENPQESVGAIERERADPAVEAGGRGATTADPAAHARDAHARCRAAAGTTTVPTSPAAITAGAERGHRRT